MYRVISTESILQTEQSQAILANGTSKVTFTSPVEGLIDAVADDLANWNVPARGIEGNEGIVEVEGQPLDPTCRKLCPPGSAWNETARDCIPCHAGTFSEGGRLAECAPCEAGTTAMHGCAAWCRCYVMQPNRSLTLDFATPILTGYFSGDGAPSCISCDSLGNYYQDLPAQPGCQPCPSNTQRFVGLLSSTNRTACQCKEGAAAACTPASCQRSCSCAVQ
jgi:hypothetical protein